MIELYTVPKEKNEEAWNITSGNNEIHLIQIVNKLKCV